MLEAEEAQRLGFLNQEFVHNLSVPTTKMGILLKAMLGTIPEPSPPVCTLAIGQKEIV